MYSLYLIKKANFCLGYNKISNSESNDQYGDIGDTEYLSADELLSDILLPPAHNPLATTVSLFYKKFNSCL